MTDPIKAKIGAAVGYEDPTFIQETNYDLADVLRAYLEWWRTKAKNEHRKVDTDEDLWEILLEADEAEFEIFGLLQLWNLTIDYDGQTDEVKVFIGKLLGV